MTREDIYQMKRWAKLLKCFRIKDAEWKADIIHNAVYDAAEAHGVTGKDVFTAVYRAFLGAPSFFLPSARQISTQN